MAMGAKRVKNKMRVNISGQYPLGTVGMCVVLPLVVTAAMTLLSNWFSSEMWRRWKAKK